MKQPSILFALESFFPTHRAGTETYVLNLAKGLMRKGWKAVVVRAIVGEDSYRYVYEGIEVYALSVPEKIMTEELNGLVAPHNLVEFQSILSQVQPDLVHFHSFSRSFGHQHLKTTYDFGVKTVFTAHLGGIFCVRGDFQLFGEQLCDGQVRPFRCSACYGVQKYAVPKAYAGAVAAQFAWVRRKKPALNLVVHKKESLQYLKNYCHQNIAIALWLKKAYEINGIPNTKLITQAIDTRSFTPKTRTKVEEKIHLGFLGRMNPSKGFYLLLEALSDLTNKFELHCITLRDQSHPTYYEKMKNQFRTLGYTDWKENLTHEELNIIMENWDIFVLPSHHEVAPLSILEAYAKQIPVIGSDYPAIAEMVKAGITGTLFKNGEAADLKKVLNGLDTHQIQTWQQQLEAPKDISELVEEHQRLYQGLLTL